MKEYHKIQSVFKRDEKTHKFIEGEWSLPEFEYLKNNLWNWTEKIDGTNIRVQWDKDEKTVTFGGRTDNAQIPTFLFTKLQQLFPIDKFENLYPDISMTLHGEGYGARIQKGGGNYIPDGVDFILFDVFIDMFWLERENVYDIAEKLELKVVPSWGIGRLEQAISCIKDGMQSAFGNFQAEGMVLRPEVEMFNRRGHRIITKIKTKDF